MQEDLDNVYSILREMKDDIDNIVVAKKSFRKTKADFADIILSFIYTLLIKFVETNKVKGILMSKKALWKIKFTSTTLIFQGKLSCMRIGFVTTR